MFGVFNAFSIFRYYWLIDQNIKLLQYQMDYYGYLVFGAFIAAKRYTSTVVFSFVSVMRRSERPALWSDSGATSAAVSAFRPRSVASSDTSPQLPASYRFTRPMATSLTLRMIGPLAFSHTVRSVATPRTSGPSCRRSWQTPDAKSSTSNPLRRYISVVHTWNLNIQYL